MKFLVLALFLFGMGMLLYGTFTGTNDLDKAGFLFLYASIQAQIAHINRDY